MLKELDLDKFIRKVPDFPKKGILFYDITSVLMQSEAFSYCIEKMESFYKDKKFDAVAAVEARGFLFAAPFALKAGLPLMLVRKKGKLPGKKISKTYSLEYGTADIEIHSGDIKKGASILLVDDLIATGGTLRAAKELIAEGGGEVTEIFGVIGLPDLNYGKILAPTPVTTLKNYSGD